MKYFNLKKRRFGIASFLFVSLISFCLLLFLFSSGNAYELVKTEQITFELQSGAKLQMTVDIGNIEFSTWDENKVFIQMRKWVDASSESQAEKKMQKLEVDFVEENDLLIISQLNRQDKSFFSNVLKKTGLKKSSSARIDFMIKIPSRLTVIIDLTKGKIKIDSLQGTLEIKLDEGEIFLGEVSLDKLDLQLGNVQTKIQKLKGQNNPGTNMVVTSKKGNFILEESFIGKMIARMKETNSYLVGDEISDCDIETDTGDLFIRPLNFKDDKFKSFSEKGDVYLLVSDQFSCSLKLETGLGIIKSAHPWAIKKRGSGYYYKLEKTNPNNGNMEIITELGDIFVENGWSKE